MVPPFDGPAFTELLERVVANNPPGIRLRAQGLALLVKAARLVRGETADPATDFATLVEQVEREVVPLLDPQTREEVFAALVDAFEQLSPDKPRKGDAS